MVLSCFQMTHRACRVYAGKVSGWKISSMSLQDPWPKDLQHKSN